MATNPLALEPIRSQPSPGNQPPQGQPYLYYDVTAEYADPNFQYWYRWLLYAWAYQPAAQFNPVPLPPGG